MAIRLDGKTVIMTGAGRGLGLMMTKGLVSAGARVAMADIDEDVLIAAAAEAEKAGGQGCVLALRADVTQEEDVAAVVERTLSAFGRADVLINDAAIGPQEADTRFMTEPRKSWLVDPEQWRRTLAINVLGPYLTVRAALPHMLEQGWGRIVNISTGLNVMYQPGCSPYGPSKAALEAYTALLADELEGSGVTANVLLPGGPADTRMIPEDGIFAEREKLVAPERMVAPIEWLASDASDGVNGMRYSAALWDPALPHAEAAEVAGALVAWKLLGIDSIRPDRPNPHAPKDT